MKHWLTLPYLNPRTDDEQAANNISAMVQLHHFGKAPKVADQVKRHINYLCVVPDQMMRKDIAY
jgi:hypothetical protein